MAATKTGAVGRKRKLEDAIEEPKHKKVAKEEEANVEAEAEAEEKKVPVTEHRIEYVRLPCLLHAQHYNTITVNAVNLLWVVAGGRYRLCHRSRRLRSARPWRGGDRKNAPWAGSLARWRKGMFDIDRSSCAWMSMVRAFWTSESSSNVHLQASMVCAGGMHTVCISSSGAVYSWGVNDEGALGRYTDGEAWKNSGRAKGTPGDSYKPAKVSMPAACGKIVALSAGDSHTMALDENGAVYGWGTFRDSGGVMGFKPGQRISVCRFALQQRLEACCRILEVKLCMILACSGC
jgi:Regulator of chromosome condensation (RCC1) repeat